MKHSETAVAVALLCTFATVSVAQGTAEATFPSRPIRMVAPSSAGGPVDLIARPVSQGLTDALGQQVVVDNRAGAAGLIGAETVAAATPAP